MTLTADLSQAETDQFTPLQLSLQLLCLVVNLKLALKERDDKRNKMQAIAKTGRGRCGEVASSGASASSG